MSEVLITCPDCGRGNFTKSGIKHHTCAAKSAGVVMWPAKKLKPHPLLSSMPMMLDDEAGMGCLEESLRTHGIQQPCLITANGLIMDGRHRWRIAEKLKMQVPCIVRPEEEAPHIILGALVNRRHLAKGAIAYLALPVLEVAAEESKNRQAANLNGQTVDQSTLGETVADACARVGVSRDLYFQAKRLREIFAEDPAYQAEVERKVLAGEVGLGAAIAGYAGRSATKGKSKPKINYAATLRTGLVATKNAFKHWKSVPLEKRIEIRELWEEVMACVPDDLNEEGAE